MWCLLVMIQPILSPRWELPPSVVAARRQGVQRTLVGDRDSHLGGVDGRDSHLGGASGGDSDLGHHKSRRGGRGVHQTG